MKLSRILPLIVGSAAAGVFASMSPAHALSWNLNNVQFTDGGSATGSFDYNAGVFSNVNISVFRPDSSLFQAFTTSNVITVDGGGNQSNFRNLWLKASPGTPGSREIRLSINSSQSFGTDGTYNLVSNNNWAVGDTYYGTSEVLRIAGINLSSGANVASAAVPFDIPGGATMPVVGSLLALGAMRKVKKSLALKTRIANPVETVVS
ncbi:hypothetical protein [Anabaena catenula]|uniref:PEP-CTERM sorting domain-containing protein n=1 Tax=Anabaena catenula FACHB-362 TaxID=2692877 RepID=A0ABR8J9D5_9NOST|nr:hypothetical protein [Anabaena catenula]MBD2694986.1 hypothetical protein [Anabaena catenula FACHB-362]